MKRIIKYSLIAVNFILFLVLTIVSINAYNHKEKVYSIMESRINKDFSSILIANSKYISSTIPKILYKGSSDIQELITVKDSIYQLENYLIELNDYLSVTNSMDTMLINNYFDYLHINLYEFIKLAELRAGGDMSISNHNLIIVLPDDLLKYFRRVDIKVTLETIHKYILKYEKAHKAEILKYQENDGKDILKSTTLRDALVTLNNALR